jgi:hypothetical protein
MPTESKFFTPKFFCLLLAEDTFTSVFKDNKLYEKVKNMQKSRFFLIFLLFDGRTRIRMQIITDQDPGGPKSYGSGSRTWHVSTVRKYVTFKQLSRPWFLRMFSLLDINQSLLLLLELPPCDESWSSCCMQGVETKTFTKTLAKIGNCCKKLRTGDDM